MSVRFRNRLWLVLLLSFLVPRAGPCEVPPAGLRFTSKTIPDVTQRTSVVLLPFQERAVPDRWSLHFDVRFWSRAYIGTITRLTLGDSSAINLVYAPYRSPDSAQFVLTFNGRQIGATSGTGKRLSELRSWLPVSVVVDRAGGRLTVALGADSIVATELTGMPASTIQIQFGVQRNTDGAMSYWGQDMPGMDLRSVDVRDDRGDVRHAWMFAEADGDIVHDRVGGADGRVEHGIWLANAHRQWRRVTSVPIWAYTRFEYDPHKHRLLALEQDRLLSFSMEDMKLEIIPFNNGKCWQAAFPLYDSVNRRLVAFFPGLGQVSVFDDSSRTWSHIDTLKSLESHYFIANAFTDPLDGAPMSVGGYGWYTVKNHLNRYSYERKQWERIPLRGDSILPRAATIAGPGPVRGTYYIFGGYGNESGRQELGFRPLYDLFLLDLRDSSLTALWSRADLKAPYWMMGTLVSDESGRAIYGMWSREDSGYAPMLIRMGIDSATFEPVGEPLTAFSLCALYYDPELQELIAAGAEAGHDSVLAIYTMAFPPATLSVTPEDHPLVSRTALLLGVSGIIVVGLVILMRMRMDNPATREHRSVVMTAPSSVPQYGGEAGHAGQGPGASRVQLFGAFSVLDAQGVELAPRFTPRLQQLFLLLLLNSYPSGRRPAGASVELVTTTLWPEADVRSAKNSRGVAMKSLREVLADAGPVHVDNDHRMYTIRFDAGMSCDYAEYRTLMKNAQDAALDSAGLQTLNSLVARGPFLADVHYDWLDAFKTEVMFEVTRTFLDHIPASDDLPAVRLHVHGLETVLAWDPLNEQAMRIAARGLTVLGMHGDAKRLFARFVEAYRVDLGRPFGKTFDQILNG